MHKLLLIIFIFLYIDDVYYWVDPSEQITPTDYTVLQGARTDSIAVPQQQEQIEIIHAQDTTVTVVVHRR